MTSRERLIRTIEGEIPDRVPISTYELVGHNPDAWENREPSYRRLMDHIREHTDCMYMVEIPMANRLPERRTVERWTEGGWHYTRTVLHTPKGDLRSLHSERDEIKTRWTIEHLLKNLDDIDAWLSIPFEPSPVDLGDYRRRQADLGDRGVMLISIDDPICVAAELFEVGEFTIQATLRPERTRYLLDAIFERQRHHLAGVLRAGVGKAIVRICGPEYATPPFLPPDAFDRFVVPYVRRYVEMIREAGAYARIHCHGCIGQVLGSIASMEPDALDPIEPPPDGDVTLAEVKRRIGDRVCLMGGIELRDLENVRPGEMDRIVREALAAAKKGGRYVIMPTAAPINIPLSPRTERNYLEFIDAALRHGAYGA